MERLTIPAEIKALDGDEGMIAGLGSTFGNVDLHGDIIERGAFADSIAAYTRGERHIAMLDHHRMDAPIGRWTKVEETEAGLSMEGRLTMGVQRARELRDLARDKALGGLSIGFRTIEDEYDRDSKARRIKRVELMEVSLVSIPANPEARIQNVKLAPDIRTRCDFERALREQLGFTARMAKAIAAGGWKGEPRDEASDVDLSELRNAVDGLKALAGIS